MSYAIEHIAERLKKARKNKGLSQRALSKLVGLPQSHISKIENGAVDLRLSSLVELARVLDLEVTIIPRKSTSTVNAIVRGTLQPVGKPVSETFKGFKKLNASLAVLSRENPALKEVAQLQRQIKEIGRFPVALNQLDPLREATRSIEAFKKSTSSVDSLRKTLAEIERFRNTLAHSGFIVEGERTVLPAYSLDDDDD